MKIVFKGLSQAVKAIQAAIPTGNMVILVNEPPKNKETGEYPAGYEDKLICQFRAADSDRQLAYTATVDRPKDFDGGFKLIVDTQQFTGILSALTGDDKEAKDEVFVSVKGNEVHVGKADKGAKSKVRIDVKSDEPAPLPEGKYLTVFRGEDKFNHFLSAGCSFADEKGEEKMQAAVIVLNTLTGDAFGYSTDSTVIGRAEAKVTMASGQNDAEKVFLAGCKERMAAYCEKYETQREEAFTIALAAQDVSLILKLAREVNSPYQVGVDDLGHVVCQFPSFVLTLTQKAKIVDPSLVNQVFAMDASGAFSMDADSLYKALDFVNNVLNLKGDKKSPLQLSMQEKTLKVFCGKGKTAEVCTDVTGVTTTGELETFAMNGRKLARAVRMIGRGNILIRHISGNGVVISLGSIADGGDESAEIFLFRVKTQADADEVTAEEAESSEAELSDDVAAAA